MSSEINLHEFGKYTKRLEELAQPRTIDIQYGQYAQYTNCFIRKFVEEKVYLVGSTSEHSKLSFSKDGGDADLIMVSGKLDIPATCLKHRNGNPCYVWIHANNKIKSLEMGLVDKKYLSANLLRDLRPELFTFLRAIHSHVTASIDRLPDADKSSTTVSVPSKVGLATTCYTGLKVHGNGVQPNHLYSRRDAVQRTDDMKQHLIKRWKTVQFHKHDKKILDRVFKVLKAAKHPGGRGESNGKFAFFVQALDDALSRESITENISMHACDGSDSTNVDKDLEENIDCINYDNNLDDEVLECNDQFTMKVTYKGKRHRDFVPALKVVGEIEYMKQWRTRVQSAGWPESKINDIYSTDVFIVSRISPVNPNTEKDFCLSFNLSELKLVKMMTSVQHKVYLTLKALLKGSFEEIHKKEGHEMKMKTYHIKTLLLWLYEPYQYSLEVDNPETVLTLLQAALDLLRNKLIERELFHYFIPSNLFMAFEDVDFMLLIECVDYVKCNPVAGMKCFFDLDDNKPVQKQATKDEMQTIVHMWRDGGRRQYVDKIEDAIIDVYRGLNECQRDAEGRLPIKDAVIDTFKLFLTDEKHVDLQIFKQINTFIRRGFTQKDDLNFAEVDKRIKDACVFVEGLGVFMPQVKNLLTAFGGRPGLHNMLEGALKGKPLDFNEDLGEQILETIDRYLSCSDEDENIIAAELKYKMLGYFSGHVEFPLLSCLRT